MRCSTTSMRSSSSNVNRLQAYADKARRAQQSVRRQRHGPVGVAAEIHQAHCSRVANQPNFDLRPPGAAERGRRPDPAPAELRPRGSTRSRPTSTRACAARRPRSSTIAREHRPPERADRHRRRRPPAQAPNDLLDQRDKQISELATHVAVNSREPGRRRAERLHRQRPVAGRWATRPPRSSRSRDPYRSRSACRSAYQSPSGAAVDLSQRALRRHRRRAARFPPRNARPGPQRARPDRRRPDLDGQCAAPRGHGPLRQARRQPLRRGRRGRAAEHRQHGHRHGRGHAHQRRRADAQRLRDVVQRRRVEHDARRHRRGGDA